MSGTTSTAAKEIREVFGITGAAIPAVRAWVKDMPFDHDGVNIQNGQVTTKIDTKTWILDTGNGQRVIVNTYDGKAGKNFDPSHFTHPMPTDEKGLKKMLKKGYSEVPVSQCPVATPIVKAESAPATPATESTAPTESAPAESLGEEFDVKESAPAAPRRGRKNA